jgi:beta-mannosidase
LRVRLPVGIHDNEYALRVCDPSLWWPWDHGEPHLYRLTACLLDLSGHVLTTHTEVFGFRSVYLERAPQRFTYYINGRPVFIRGASYMPDIYLSRCTQESLAVDLKLARDAHLNLLRAHVHISPPEFYDLCDRMGLLVWQDFELNWIHHSTPEFEARARTLQREMIASLYNHPSIITWSCHNEPTMIFARRDNLEKHPDPALYADALQQDPTRPVFMCSGQMEHDWQRSGDVHTYYGAIWTARYTDVYRHRPRLNTEFGFEAPAHQNTLQAYPECWSHLQHLADVIDDLWAYQAELIRFHIELFRRLRAESCAGYIHFWLADLVPQVGCGVLDSHRQPKGGYDALRCASKPLQVALEHDG